MNHQAQFAFGNELIVDLFAGGGGASLGIEQAFGRHVDVAVNHDAEAVAMHAINHPHTQHYVRDVFEVDPLIATGGRQVGLLWASPDCKHFSKAKGGKPRSKKVRGLAWVVVKWAAAVRPRVIMLENVEEFVTWGPLVNGQPCPDRKGFTFRRWKKQLEALGYVVEHREMRACDYGAPTIRKRFFLVARRDGRPIVWPKPTHGKPDSREVLSGKLLPWRTAAECIDWTLPVHSIFLTPEEARAVGVKRPLAEATMNRIAKGVKRFVLEAAKPFIVPIQNYGWGDRCGDVADPLRTVTAGPKGGAFAVCAPTLVDVAHGEVSPAGVKRWGSGARDIAQPMSTVTASGGNAALVAPTLIQTGYGERAGQEPRAPGLDVPLGTCMAGGVKHALVAPLLDRQFGASAGNSAEMPLGTTTAGGGGKSALLTAFLTKYHGAKSEDEARGQQPDAVMPTLDTSNRVSIIAAHLEQANAGNYTGSGHAATEPVSTVTSTGAQQRLVTSSLVKLRGTSSVADSADPLHTVSAQGTHHALAVSHLSAFGQNAQGHSPDDPAQTILAGATRYAEVRAFLIKFYSEGGQHQACDDPMHTVPTRDRLGLVTVDGTDYAIADIGLRMLAPRELFRAQGFPDHYVIDVGLNGRKLPKDAQVRMCGNSVCPPMSRAMVLANCAALIAAERSAA